MCFPAERLLFPHDPESFPIFPVTVVDMITGQQLREARLRRGWSQGQLADKLGVTERSIGNWERRGIPATQQVRIADVTR
ncbi:helix-turn-helix transcriptional regulator [Segatella copri]|jgi:hypothetical protein|uniref:helix-turn-helix transcriptional regulator n=1 Tax=Bacteria TaxID=2 RepID=UPI003F8BD0AA